MFLSISMILVMVMYSKGHVTIFIQAITGLEVWFVSFLFVDDTDLFKMACYLEESSDSIMARIQEGGLTWHGALDVSGGALEVEKCYWTLYTLGGSTEHGDMLQARRPPHQLPFLT